MKDERDYYLDTGLPFTLVLIYLCYICYSSSRSFQSITRTLRKCSRFHPKKFFLFSLLILPLMFFNL